MRGRVVCILAVVACSVVVVPTARAGDHAITFVGVYRDQVDFTRLRVGQAGYWFAQFGATEPVTEQPTGDNARDELPAWAGPLNHATAEPEDLPAFGTRSFSQDGPARSAGGRSTWDTFTLPNGETGRSGAIVDPHTAGGTNNTINRISLTDGVPETFYFHVVVGNTNNDHDPTGRIRARGRDVAAHWLAGSFLSEVPSIPEPASSTVNGPDVDPDPFPRRPGLEFNNTADVYTFRYDGFEPGDYMKLQLEGGPNGASFSGLLFDDATFDPSDRDGDGLLDADDACPDAAASTASGCPARGRPPSPPRGPRR